MCVPLTPALWRMETGKLLELVGQPVWEGTEQDREKGVTSNEPQVPCDILSQGGE